MAYGTIDDLIFKIGALKKTVKAEIPRELATVMLKQTAQSFEQERFAGKNSEKWPDRRSFGGEENILYPKLQFKGTLRNSFRYKIGSTGANRITISVGTNVKYAKAHNEGSTPPPHTGIRSSHRGDVRAGRWKFSGTPYKRQFLGVGYRTIINFRLKLDNFFRHNMHRL